MKRKSCFQCALFILMAALAITVWSLQPFEPRYGGKGLSAWAKDLTILDYLDALKPGETDRDRHERYDKAADAVRHIGTNALPYALSLCQARDSAFKRKLIKLVDSQEVTHFHFLYAEDKRLEGVEIIGALGPDAKPAIPSLIKLLQREDYSAASTASYALASIGPDAVAPLIEMLGDRNQVTRALAARALGYVQPKAQVAVPALLRCLADEAPGVRESGARSLGYIGGDATVIVPALVNCLEQETNFLPHGIFSALQRFGTNATLAVPALVKFIDSNQGFAAASALSTLRRIDPETANQFGPRGFKFVRTNAPPHLPESGSPGLRRRTNSPVQAPNSNE